MYSNLQVLVAFPLVTLYVFIFDYNFYAYIWSAKKLESNGIQHNYILKLSFFNQCSSKSKKSCPFWEEKKLLLVFYALVSSIILKVDIS